MHRPNREARQREAFRLTNDLLHDLVTGGSTYIIFRTLWQSHNTAVPPDVQTSATRLCLFHAIITLSKWVEFYDRYRDVIPKDVMALAKQLRSEIHARGIVDFRNKVVGHVWDDERRRALTNAEVDEHVATLTGSDVGRFLEWAAEPLSTINTHSPVAIMEQVREGIRDAYALTDHDLQL